MKVEQFVMAYGIEQDRIRALLPEGAHGVSIGKTLPTIPTEKAHTYPRQAFTVEKAATVPCAQVLGTYVVAFERVE